MDELLCEDKNEIFYSARIIIIGDQSVGKTNIIYRFSSDKFMEEYNCSIGVDFFTKYLEVDQRKFKLQLWDTAGQENFRSITRAYYKNSACAIIVYDVTEKNSFKSVKEWIVECKNYTNENIILILVGNKKDLEDSRKISEKEGREFAEQNGIDCFFESSAKTGENINEIFQHICKIINKRIDDNAIYFSDESNGIKLVKKDKDNDNNKKNNFSCCCCCC